MAFADLNICIKWALQIRTYAVFEALSGTFVDTLLHYSKHLQTRASALSATFTEANV